MITHDKIVKAILKINSDAKVNIGDELIKIDPRYFRPSEVNNLLGDYSKAKKLLNWSPKYTLDSLIDEMIKHDLNIFKP